MNLIPNPGQWHKLWSMRLAILTTAYSAAAGAYVTLPADWIPRIPEHWKVVLAVLGCALPALTGVSRLIAQPALQRPPVTVPENKQ